MSNSSMRAVGNSDLAHDDSKDATRMAELGDENTMSESAGEHLYIDPVKEAKLLRKLDLFLIPIIMLAYLPASWTVPTLVNLSPTLSSLAMLLSLQALITYDPNTSAGNVRVAGMPEDIGASEAEFATAISIFYATYVAFETPLAILTKRFTPRNLLTGLCIAWSLVTVFSGFITNIGGLYASRLILGACEAGLFPGLNLYLTMVYRREEQAKRVSYLFACTALAGAFGGLLAYALLKMDGVSGVAGWRWVYYLEGAFSIFVGVAVWFGLPNDPANAYFLTTEEKQMMAVRAAINQQYMGSEDFDWKEIKAGLQDPKVYLSGLIQFCQNILLNGFSTFLPSILRALGYAGLSTQYLTIPVYLLGALVFLVVAIISDRMRLRFPFFFATNFVGIAGYIVLLTVSNNSVKYVATYLCAVAVYTGPGLNLTWLNVNVAPQYHRAAAIGLQQTMGNSAGIVAGQIYRSPPYLLGNAFSLGVLGVAQVTILVLAQYLKYSTKKKAKIAAGLFEDKRLLKTGDRELDFKYHY